MAVIALKNGWSVGADGGTTTYSGEMSGTSFRADVKVNKNVAKIGDWHLQAGLGARVASYVQDEPVQQTALTYDLLYDLPLSVTEPMDVGTVSAQGKTLQGMIGPVAPTLSVMIGRSISNDAKLAFGVHVSGNAVKTTNYESDIWYGGSVGGLYLFGSSVVPDRTTSTKQYGATLDVDAISIETGALTLAAGPSFALNRGLDKPLSGIGFRAGVNFSQLFS